MMVANSVVSMEILYSKHLPISGREFDAYSHGMERRRRIVLQCRSQSTSRSLSRNSLQNATNHLLLEANASSPTDLGRARPPKRRRTAVHDRKPVGRTPIGKGGPECSHARASATAIARQSRLLAVELDRADVRRFPSSTASRLSRRFRLYECRSRDRCSMGEIDAESYVSSLVCGYRFGQSCLSF